MTYFSLNYFLLIVESFMLSCFHAFISHLTNSQPQWECLLKNIVPYVCQMLVMQFAHPFACLPFCTHVCCQRSRGTRVVWAVGGTAILTSQPASASVSQASPDDSARVPFISALSGIWHVVLKFLSFLQCTFFKFFAAQLNHGERYFGDYLSKM